MGNKSAYTAEQSIPKLRGAEMLTRQGKTMQKLCRTLEVSEQTCSRWGNDYRGLDAAQARKLKELEKENFFEHREEEALRGIKPPMSMSLNRLWMMTCASTTKERCI